MMLQPLKRLLTGVTLPITILIPVSGDLLIPEALASPLENQIIANERDSRGRTLRDRKNHSPAMRPEFTQDLDLFQNSDSYTIQAELTFDPDAVIQGTQQVRYTNFNEIERDRIVFRLYPNTPPLKNAGEMSVSNVTVNGQPVSTQLSVENTVLTVLLKDPLPPGQTVTLNLDFTLRLYERQISQAFERMGFLNNVVSGASWYPALSVDEEKRGWWTTPILSGEGDPTYSNLGLYEVHLTVPKAVQLITNGTIINQTVHPDGRITYHDITGPVRSHVFVASDRYTLSEMRDVEGVKVQVWSYQDDPETTSDRNQAALQTTIDALSIFNQTFTPYPYREFDIVQHPTNTGLEFLGLIFLSESDWRNGTLEPIIAHEVAHQWFYGLVGNNQVEHPWLDEALATYSGVVIYERAVNDNQQSNSDQMFQESPDFRNFLANLGQEIENQTHNIPPLNLPVADYKDSPYSYEVVYSVGSLFYFWLEKELGQAVVYEALQEYSERFRYQMATTEDIKAIFEEVSGRDLTAIFEAWMGSELESDRPVR